MSAIDRWLKGIFLNRLVLRIAKALEGKKTVIGAINLLLWIAIYAVPAFTPDYNWITVAATQIRDALIAAGINLDNELFNTGVGFTVVGLFDKIRQLLNKDKNEYGK